MAIFIAVTAIAVAPAIVAEIRAEAGGTTGEIFETEATAQTNVKLVKARPGEAVVVDETDDMLLIDASAGDLRVELPKPSAFGNRTLTLERIDQTDHDVVLDPLDDPLIRRTRSCGCSSRTVLGRCATTASPSSRRAPWA